MLSQSRLFDRALIAKLSDARERLHHLADRATDESAREQAAALARPGTDGAHEVRRG